MKTLLLLAVLIPVFSCHKSTVSKKKLCATLVKSGDNVSVCPQMITIDCRCPANVQCVWQGYATLQCQFTKNDSSATLHLSTYRDSALGLLPDTTLMGYQVQLIGLSGQGEPLQADIVITPE